jgi:hypothetical protein
MGQGFHMIKNLKQSGHIVCSSAGSTKTRAHIHQNAN